jgi:hypothetical protein
MSKSIKRLEKRKRRKRWINRKKQESKQLKK